MRFILKDKADGKLNTRFKNVKNNLLVSYACAILITLIFIIWGYYFAVGNSRNSMGLIILYLLALAILFSLPARRSRAARILKRKLVKEIEFNETGFTALTWDNDTFSEKSLKAKRSYPYSLTYFFNESFNLNQADLKKSMFELEVGNNKVYIVPVFFEHSTLLLECLEKSGNIS